MATDWKKRLADAQSRFNMARIGDHVQIDDDLVPHIRRRLPTLKDEMVALLKRCRMSAEAVIIDEGCVAHGLWQGPMLPRLIEDIDALLAKAEAK